MLEKLRIAQRICIEALQFPEPLAAFSRLNERLDQEQARGRIAPLQRNRLPRLHKGTREFPPLLARSSAFYMLRDLTRDR